MDPHMILEKLCEQCHHHHDHSDNKSSSNSVIRGIMNQYNSCFVSCVIQCMFVCCGFRRILCDLWPMIEHISPAKYPYTHSMLQFYHSVYSNVTSQEIVKPLVATAPVRKSDTSVAPETMTKSQRRNMKRRERRRQKQQQKEEQQASEQSAAQKQQDGVARGAYSRVPCSPDALSPFVHAFQKKDLGRHEDAQEFFLFIVSELHSELMSLMRVHGVRVASDKSNTDDSNDGWVEVGKKNKVCTVSQTLMEISPMSACFGGRIRWFIHKRRSARDSLSYQPFYTVPVEIHRETKSLEDALQKFIDSQELTGAHQERVHARQSCGFEASSLPHVLVIHVKRFRYEANRGRSSKISQKMHVPMTIDIAPYVSGGAASCGTEYNLVGAIVHHGQDVTQGHYTAGVAVLDTQRKDDTAHKYFAINDSRTTPVSLVDFQKYADMAYVLFFSH